MDLSNNKINNTISKTSSKGYGLNIVDIKGIGKASLELLNNEFIIKSMESDYNYSKSLDYMDFLLYSKGILILKDKFIIGLAGNQFEITCKEDANDFKTFYNNIKQIKNNGKTKDIKDLSNNSLNNNLVSKDISTNNEEVKSENTEESVVSVSEEIRNFHNLMKEGIITEEEFEEKKKELLKS